MADTTSTAPKAAPAKAAPASAAPALLLPPDIATWAIDADRLESLVQQETNLTRGDEVYVASIAFRVTPGTAGSARAWFHGGLVDMTNVSEGETHTVPNGMGRVTFDQVRRLHIVDLATLVPELIGTLTLVFESDLSPNGAIDDLLTDVASGVRQVLAAEIEPLEPGGDLAAQLDGLGAKVEAAVAPTAREKVRLFLASIGDPDDLIAEKVNVFAAVDDLLAPIADQQLGGAIPSALGVGGGLRARTYTQRFVGNGAKYRVAFSVSK